MSHPGIEVKLDEGQKTAYIIISDSEVYPTVSDVVKALEENGITYWIDEGGIRRALEGRILGEPVVAARARNGRVELAVSTSAMEAHMTLRPPYGGNAVTVSDVRQMLAEREIVYGVDNAAIESAVEEGRCGEAILVASGKSAVPAYDAKVEYLFETSTMIRPKEIEHDMVDFRELQTVLSVRKDTILSRKTPAVRGENGMTITGKPINVKPAKDIKLVAGKGTRLSEDGLDVIATIDGQPILKERTLTVEPVLAISGDVDFDTGNINFAGSLIITGSITSGFSVRATENIEIDGLVEDCCVEAGGDILIKGGIQGRDKGVVRAGGHVGALFVQHGAIEAGEDITVGEVLHSNLSAGRTIVVRSGKGRILGGKVSAQNLIEAKVIGSESNVRTELRVGFKPKEKKRLEEKKAQKTQSESSLIEVRKGLIILEQQRQQGTLHEVKEILYKRLVLTSQELAQSIDDLREEIAALEESIEKAVKPEIRVSKVMHPNVTVGIGNLSLEVRSEITCSTLYEADGQIQTAPYVA
jgi:uncharacterized protein